MSSTSVSIWLMIKEAKKTKSIKASVGYSIIIPGFYTAWGGKKRLTS